MPRNVDEAEDAAVGRRQIGEAEIDRDAARLFFSQAVGVDPGKSANQRCLAVINMPGGPDDHAGAGI